MHGIKDMSRLVLTLLMLAIALWARSPLSEELLNAKKIFMNNQSSDVQQFDALRDALVSWGRWEVVTGKDDADLILSFYIESKTTRQTLQSCIACPPSEAVLEKEINRINIAGKDGTIYLAIDKEKNPGYSPQAQAQWLVGAVRKKLNSKKS
jgi:hypothetical protein